MPLPKWAVDNATSLRREAAPYLALEPEQRALELRAVCRSAARLLRARGDAERILNLVEPLPESSRQALRRLREQKREHGIVPSE
ncbi:MAG: hypothetical protein RLZZ450_543 [Pseudomonadota bacterium]|jgi:hypothetical protein